MSNNYLKQPYTNKNKLCNIINNERPSQMLKYQLSYKASNLRQYGRYITNKGIHDYNFEHNVNINKITNPEFEEISFFANYIVGINIAHVAFLREKLPYLPQEIWLYIGLFMGYQFKTHTYINIVMRCSPNFYREYNMSIVFNNNYNSLQNRYNCERKMKNYS